MNNLNGHYGNEHIKEEVGEISRNHFALVKRKNVLFEEMMYFTFSFRLPSRNPLNLKDHFYLETFEKTVHAKFDVSECAQQI